MTKERHGATVEGQVADLFDDDVTWHGLVDRAMRAARSGRPDSAADLCVLAVLRVAIASGLDRALCAGTSAEAFAYVRALVTRSPPVVALSPFHPPPGR